MRTKKSRRYGSLPLYLGCACVVFGNAGVLLSTKFELNIKWSFFTHFFRKSISFIALQTELFREDRRVLSRLVHKQIKSVTRLNIKATVLIYNSSFAKYKLVPMPACACYI